MKMSHKGEFLRRQRELSRSLWDKFVRLLRHRLVLPTLRSRRPPKEIARSAFVGLTWAFTPLVGIQMPLCFITWLIADRMFKWRFSFAISCVWTWVTNVFTMLPCYYVFYLTGQFMLGSRYSASYEGFVRLFKRAFAESAGPWEFLHSLGTVLVKDWGVAMAVGCLPYVLVAAFAGYHYVLKYATAKQASRERRRLECRRKASSEKEKESCE